MKTKLFTFFSGMLLFGSSHFAQVSNYTFTQTLGSYGPTNTGTFIGIPLQDDDVTTASLPFPFVYNGNTYNSIEVCSNGYLSFGALTGTEYLPISNASTQDLIAPFGQDIFMGTVLVGDLTLGSNTITNCSSVVGYSVGDVLLDYNSDFANTNPTITAISGSNIEVNVNASSTTSGYDVLNFHGSIKQDVSGTTPNRICEFEYLNFCRYGVYDENIRFKVRFYETSNKIEFVYGTMILGQDNTPSQVGLKGTNNTDFNSRSVSASNTWSNSAASVAITNACQVQATKFPQAGQSYAWSPFSCVTPTITVSQSNSIICNGASVTFTASGASSYTWTGGATGSVTVFSPSNSTSYTVSANSGTCVGLSVVNVMVTQCTGISKLIAGTAEFVAYPNPFSSSLKLENPTATAMNVTLSDALGRVVYQAVIKGGEASEIDTQNLNEGFYVVTLSNNEGSSTKKLIKE